MTISNLLGWKVLSILILSFLFSACGNLGHIPLSEQGHAYGESDSEQKLLAESKRLQRELDHKGLLLEEASLITYLNKVGQRVISPKAASILQPRFMLIRSHVLNAFALPNGDIYVTVGLLAHLESEAQLAMILAHEYAHIEYRHSLSTYKNHRSTMMAANIADIFLAGTRLSYLPALAAVSRYSRDQEKLADRVALERVIAAGYDSDSAIQVFEILAMANQSESGQNAIFRSHPETQQRISNLRDQQVKQKRTPPKLLASEPFMAARRLVLKECADLTLRAARYQLAYSLGKKAQTIFPDKAWPIVVQGEAKRMMAENPRAAADEAMRQTGKLAEETLVQSYQNRHDEFLVEAEKLFSIALRLEADDPEAIRGMGLVYWLRGNTTAARPLLQRYLERSPNALDRLYIANLLKQGGSNEKQ